MIHPFFSQIVNSTKLSVPKLSIATPETVKTMLHLKNIATRPARGEPNTVAKDTGSATREACRGTVKDMDTKFFKALDVRIADLKALKVKKGASFSAGEQRELTRLTGAREYYGGVRETLNDVSTGKLRPGEYEDAILKQTGDKDLLETISDMRDLMKSLVL